MANFGHINSQYNIAVMLSKGQGVEKNLIQAYAWSKLSNIDNNNLTNLIEKELSIDELVEAKNLSKSHTNEYSQNRVKVLLGPITNNKANAKGAEADSFELIAIYKKAPEYPREQIIKGMEGWVDLLYNVYPDGSVRDIQIVDELPANSFSKSAVQSVEKYKYSFKNNGVASEIYEPISVSSRIIYKISHNELTNEFGHTKKQENYLNNLISKANDGDIGAQYNYAVLFETFLNKKGNVPAKKINQWLFNAAQSGSLDAQYRLGKNIYYGKACKVEKQKGLDWIMHAAQMGNSNAEYMAYQMLQSDKIINQSKQTPMYWLEQAAENGSQIAQLRLAKEIVIGENPSEEQLN